MRGTGSRCRAGTLKVPLVNAVGLIGKVDQRLEALPEFHHEKGVFKSFSNQFLSQTAKKAAEDFSYPGTRGGIARRDPAT